MEGTKEKSLVEQKEIARDVNEGYLTCLAVFSHRHRPFPDLSRSGHFHVVIHLLLALWGHESFEGI